MDEAQRELGVPEARKLREAIYGVNKDQLGRVGPSVVSINGVVASLVVTEFMVGVTGVRQAQRLITYRGDMAKVFVSQDLAQPDCYYCKAVWGRGDQADVQRYIRAGVGTFSAKTCSCLPFRQCAHFPFVASLRDFPYRPFSLPTSPPRVAQDTSRPPRGLVMSEHRPNFDGRKRL